MSDLTLYMNPMSRSRIVRWMLEECGAEYETVMLEYGTTMKAAHYLAINPMGKVPAIRHGDTVVTEGAAICAYLADIFPDSGLAPAPGTRERGSYYRWLFFGAGPVEQAVTNASFGWVAEGPEGQRRVGYGTLETVCDTLEALLSDGRDYILGSAFSAADVYLGSQIVWGRQFGTLPDRPSFAAYADRLIARPAAVRARELDDARIPQEG